MWVLLALLCGFTVALIFISRELRLYSPLRLNSHLNEQKLSALACLSSGLLLTGALYLLDADDVPRDLVLSTLGLVTISLGLRRLVYRSLLYRRHSCGMDTRNVLILGTGDVAKALRNHVENIRHLGYKFKGLVHFPESGASITATSADVVCAFDELFQYARRQFVDEIFLTTQCERKVVQDLLAKASKHGIDLRVVPDMYNGLAWNSPIEYIGEFPTVPLFCNNLSAGRLLLKRGIDISISSLTLLLLSPLFAAIAIAIKLDSRGPVFYSSQRIGKKGGFLVDAENQGVQRGLEAGV